MDNAESGQSAGLLLIRGGDLYAPEPLGRQDLLVAAGRIVAIAPDLAVTGLPGLRVIDAAGSRVVPGFVDAHAHVLGGGGEGGPETRNRDLLLGEAIAAGVTTVVGCLGTDTATRDLRGLLAKARALEAEGLTTFITTGGYPVPTPTLTGGVLSDLVLIERVVGVGEIAISDHRSSHAPHEELVRLATDAHMGGLFGKKAGAVIFHVGVGKPGLAPLRRLLDETDLPTTQFLPTHINRARPLWDEAVAFALAGGTIDITAGIAPAHGFPTALKPSEAIVEALARGVPPEHLTMSSDANGNMIQRDAAGRVTGVVTQSMRWLFDEFRDLVRAHGVPLQTALLPFTTNPARCFALQGKGRLAVGADADLLLLDDDLEPRAVIARGSVLREDGRAIVKGVFE